MPITSPTSPSINNTHIVGFKNRIHNPRFTIMQRGHKVVTSYGYTFDRWLCYSSTSCSYEVYDERSGHSGALLHSGDTAPDFLLLEQRMEGEDISDFANQFVTFSFKAKRVDLGVFSGKLNVVYQHGLDGDIVDNGTVIEVDSNISGVSTTDYKHYSVTFKMPAIPRDAYFRIAIYFKDIVNATANSRFFKITDVQLEKGLAATGVEYRTRSTELLTCQRYYYQSPVVYNGLLGGVVYNRAYHSNTYRFPVEMRCAPSVMIKTNNLDDNRIYLYDKDNIVSLDTAIHSYKDGFNLFAYKKDWDGGSVLGGFNTIIASADL